MLDLEAAKTLLLADYDSPTLLLRVRIRRALSDAGYGDK